MGFEDCWRPRNIQEFLQESESCGLNEPVFDDLTDFPLLNQHSELERSTIFKNGNSTTYFNGHFQ